jgi:hypothetical protein
MKLEDFDIFPKIQEDQIRQTAQSGSLTIICIVVMSYLALVQSWQFFATPPRQRLRVDETPLATTAGGILDRGRLRKIQINFDLTLPSLPCAFVNFGALDTFKEMHNEAFAQVKLRRLDRAGNVIKSKNKALVAVSECGSCYGASGGCCNTCKDVKKAFKAKGRAPPPLSTIEQCKGKELEYEVIKNEQCRIYGTLTVPPVTGLFYIAPGDTYGARARHVEDYLAMNLTVDDFNLSHRIASFYVGESGQDEKILDNTVCVQKEKGRLKSLYFIRSIREKVRSSDIYRSTVQHYDRYREGSSGKFPGIFFYYSTAPIVVEYKRDVSFLHFVVDLMAILGGIFSLGVLVDHFISGR